MRYTKDLQEKICSDIKYGLSPTECSDKYGIPVSVILKWSNLNVNEQRAKEIALRKYQVSVSNTEADLTNMFAQYLDPDMSDEDFFRVSEQVAKRLYELAADIIKEERDLNLLPDESKDAQIIVEITNKWKDNKFLKMYSV